MSHKAGLFRSHLKERFIDLTGKTTPFEAFSLVGKAKLMLTEDSGLMHMAWVQGVPTIALFGSSPDYWSAPLGEWSQCLSSSDLPCGNCFSETCQFGDVHCLTRYTPEFVVEAACSLLSKLCK
jgi:heptosyltransferase-2